MKLNDEQREFLRKEQLRVARMHENLVAPIADMVLNYLLELDKRG